ncbi:enoyl-CoA hydratase [marine gamma proteobacterium HTCC2143]|jgi:enoyl-CoA hydratase/carnithine racemase|uniref:Enoyl-CoA hydratase n=1 Tax=marine gamma proteobacterium HTCC2143 TaxID=247633 RepID=A0YBG9_9GAMM|nr:enoyl-CoA hydratase [marine gamma proteobacterium HTCC2143]
MELKDTLYDVSDRVATITLNRPHRANAWTGRMHTEYRYLLQQADVDPDVGVIIVTGADNYFCVGADTNGLLGFSESGEYSSGTGPDLVMPGSNEFPAFLHEYVYHFALAKPVIAAISGPAAGVGFVLACYTDIRFAVPGVKLTTAHGPLNLPVECGLSWLLPRLIGGSRATELLISSRKFLTDEAHQLGLVHRLVEREHLMTEVRAYAIDLITRNSPESLRQSKRQTYIDWHRDVGTATREAGDLLQAMVKQPNYKVGINALTKKATPKWR